METTTTRSRLLRTVVLIALVSVFFFPVAWTLSIGLRTTASTFARPPELIFRPTWEHYGSVFSDGAIVGALINSIVVSGVSTLLIIVIGTPAAYALARLKVKGRDDIMMFVLAGRMAPPVALIIPFFLIYMNIGLLENRFGLILAYLTFNLSFYVWVLTIFIREIPHELEGAGYVDGYGPMQVFVKIVLPLMRPSVIATGLLAFIFAWNEFAFALILGGRAAETLPVVISRAITPAGVQFGELAAMGAIALLPISILVFLLYKHIVRGLAMGAVKG